ncbi:hypothetical protein L6R52_14780, partial [Myxococcota bacterium]|nr:hypothetical protein [Myxococcota bacterium]
RDAGLDAGRDAEPEDVGPPPDAGLPTYTWSQHVQPIIAARCLDCHGAQPMFGAPMSLVTYADTQVILPLRDKPVHQLMAERVKSTNPNLRMPYGRPALSAVEIELVEFWSAVGALEGDPADAGLHDDAAEPDTGADDAAEPDTGADDAAEPDTGVADAGEADAG